MSDPARDTSQKTRPTRSNGDDEQGSRPPTQLSAGGKRKRARLPRDDEGAESTNAESTNRQVPRIAVRADASRGPGRTGSRIKVMGNATEATTTKATGVDESLLLPSLQMTSTGPDRPPAPGYLGKNHSSLKARARTLLELRKRLPIWPHAAEVRESLRENDILLLVGETGSGKSTQVPQFLINEPWCRSQTVRSKVDGTVQSIHVGGCIAVTEPRRVAAVSLARRVAEEMGTPLGSSSPASKVGYSVRFDTSTSPSTQIKFLTEGMLIQEMLRDPWLQKYSAVVVDEVHERSVNVDLVLGFLRIINARKEEGRGGIALKTIVMSATADTAKLLRFFEQHQNTTKLVEEDRSFIGNPHSTKDEMQAHPEDSEWSGISSSEADSEVSIPGETSGQGTSESLVLIGDEHKPKREFQNQDNKFSVNGDGLINLEDQKKERNSSRITTCYIKGRQYQVKTIYTPEPVQDFVDASLRTIFQIHYKEPLPGDILVFLTGQETVESLESLVNEYSLNMSSDLPKLLVLPLFAALPQASQQRVFHPAPANTRKVILATNIAETSVTLSGVRYVIDCGKAKVKQYRSRIGLDSLLVKPISKSAAIQRKGRAGREAPGQCYRLYTEQDYKLLEDSNTPEILRCDLGQAILTVKARGVKDMTDFLFIDQPSQEALKKALVQLFQLKALDESGSISEVGLRMAKLPLPVSLSRSLLAAAEPGMDCMSEVIDIISCLSVENIFLNLASEEKKEQAELARRELYQREGDHLTLLATVQMYAAENVDRKAWAERHFVSHRAMQAVMDVRKQLRAQSRQIDALERLGAGASSTLTGERRVAILQCFLSGFATNTARLIPDGSYRTLVGNQTVAIHPSSGLFGKKVEAIMYNEFVFTNRSYARGVSAVQMDWIGNALGCCSS